jgi:hypothetical protein
MQGLEVIPSKADYGYTSGVFGNSNGNANDDIIFDSNGYYVSDAFLEKYKYVKKRMLSSKYLSKKKLLKYLLKLKLSQFNE